MASLFLHGSNTVLGNDKMLKYLIIVDVPVNIG